MSDQNKPLVEKEEKEPMIMPVKVSLGIGAVGFIIALVLIIAFATTSHDDPIHSDSSSL